MGRWRISWALPLLTAVAAAAACLPGAGPPLNPYVDDAGAPPPTQLGDDGGGLLDVSLGPPFAVAGLQPSHGPWTGGTRTTIAGRGFSSSLQVWIGGALLPAASVFASDPAHVTVVTPQGAPGPADVRVHDLPSGQDATLPAGFDYESFAVTPGSGATTGGTRIALQGKGTAWTKASMVTIDGKPCTGLSFQDAADLSCLTPPDAAGSQNVTVTNADGSVDLARDAFVYSDSPDGYRGGLYGGALAGTLTVIAFDSWVGTPVSGVAIAGSSLASAVTASFDASGTAHLAAPGLTGKVTVTIVAHCHQPQTYVDVPVDTVTAYLDPILDPSCAQGDPPSTGNWWPSDTGEIDGELVWTGGIEFQRSTWGNVPMPASATQRQAAYVWTTTGDPRAQFWLPPQSSTTTPQSPGQLGYGFALGGVQPGNRTVYALAGIEDDGPTPPTFEPFAMGLASGVSVQPGTKTVGVYIPMTTLFDRTMTTAPQPPPSTPRGPDRLVSTLAIALGPSGYLTLPQGTRTTLLPLSGDVDFVGVPALDGTLVGASYALTASAVTGSSRADPVSVVAAIQTTDANDPLTIGGFFTVPGLVVPGLGTWSGTHVQLSASGPVDLAVVAVASGGGLVTWRIVTPGSTLSFDLPDISQVPGVGSLLHGPITSTFQIARLTGFDYGTLRTGQLSPSSWNAYAEDSSPGSY